MENAAFERRSRVFLVLWIVNFVFTFVVSLISTPLPYLTKEFVASENAEAATMEAYGVVLSLGYVAMTLGFFLGGFAADRLGRRNVVIASFAILAAGCGMFAGAGNLYFLFLASFVQQFAAGFSGPAISALVADYSVQRSRGMAYGVFNLSWITAQIPAPLLGGALAQFVNVRTPFITAVLISLIGITFSFRMRGNHVEKKPAGEKSDEKPAETDSNPVMPLKKVILMFSTANLLNGLLNGFVGPLMNGLLVFRLGADPTEYGLVLSLAFGLVTGLVQIPGGKIADKFGRKPLVFVAFLGVPLVIALAFSQSLLEFALIMGGISAVGNICSPALSAWMMDLIPRAKRASVSGITRTLNGIGLSIGPNAGSYAWNSTKPDAVIPCGIAALIFAVSLVAYLGLKEPRSSTDNEKASKPSTEYADG